MSVVQPRLLAVYGTLIDGLALPNQPSLDGLLARTGRACRIAGVLHDLGDYPGLRPGDGVVVGELLEIVGVDALAVLDRFEDFDPADPDGSEYVRGAIELLDPPGEPAWTYFLNREPPPGSAIASGSWRDHIAANPRGPAAPRKTR